MKQTEVLRKELCKRLRTSRLHELHESKLMFVSVIEFISSKLSIFCSACNRGRRHRLWDRAFVGSRSRPSELAICIKCRVSRIGRQSRSARRCRIIRLSLAYKSTHSKTRACGLYFVGRCKLINAGLLADGGRGRRRAPSP